MSLNTDWQKFIMNEGLDEKTIKGIIENELELLDIETHSEDRRLFDNLVQFFSENKTNSSKNTFIENLKKYQLVREKNH